MKRVKIGALIGLIFGLLDVLIMLPLEIPDKAVALAGAFASRFAIGFLIPNIQLPAPFWLRGLIVGALVSLPDAIITKAYGPVMGIGLVGGTLIGLITSRLEGKIED